MKRSRPTIVASLVLILFSALAIPGVLAQSERAAGAARITGGVWDAGDRGVGGVGVRLRNVTTGDIQASMRTDNAGQFLFQGVDAGSYVVEVVNGNGTIAAVGQSFAVGAGESVATFVRLGPKVPLMAGFFSNAAAAAVATAASLGVTAITPAGQNISPGQ